MKLTGRTAQRTLAYVNRLRAQEQLPPVEKLPAGRLNSASLCPVAKALGEGYDGYVEITNRDIRWYSREDVYRKSVWMWMVPVYVRDFIWAFDKERIPELIDR